MVDPHVPPVPDEPDAPEMPVESEAMEPAVAAADDPPADIPLNRAARRARARRATPTHVGPIGSRSTPEASPRSHTKRQSS